MKPKIQFDWQEFRNIYSELSKTEEVVIEQHFNIWIEGNLSMEDCSAPEMRSMYDQFKSTWIMCQMFTK